MREVEVAERGPRARRGGADSVIDQPLVDGRWRVPERFNFARDVVERLAADPSRRTMLFVDRDGRRSERTFAVSPRTTSSASATRCRPASR